MSKLKINDYFKSVYLTCGQTRDNFIFEHCPIEFIHMAKRLLSNGNDKVKPCIVSLTKIEEQSIEKTLLNCSSDLQKKLIARDYVCAKIMSALVEGFEDKQEYLDMLNKGLSAILNNDWQSVKNFHCNCPMPHDVSRFSQNVNKIELNFMLVDVDNILLQQAVNIFISSREPYSVKIFTTRENLSTYYDLNGSLIECPHDYMHRNVNEYIEECENELDK